MQAGVPIVPIVIRNAGELMWRGSSLVRAGTVDVVVLPPVPTDDWTGRRPRPAHRRDPAGSTPTRSRSWPDRPRRPSRRRSCTHDAQRGGDRRRIVGHDGRLAGRRAGAARSCGRGAPTTAEEIATAHTNSRYLGDAPLDPALRATARLEEAVAGADVLIMGVPSHGFRATLREMAPHMRPGSPVISLSKGLEPETRLRMTEVVAEEAARSPGGRAHRPQPGEGGAGRRRARRRSWPCPTSRSRGRIQEVLSARPLQDLPQHRRRGRGDRGRAQERVRDRGRDGGRPRQRRQHARARDVPRRSRR